MNVIAVIPAFNEASRIVAVIESLRANGYPVIVIDDGSSDETTQVAKKAVFVLCNYGLLHRGVEMGGGLGDFSGSLFMSEEAADAVGALRMHPLRRGRLLTDEELQQMDDVAAREGEAFCQRAFALPASQTPSTPPSLAA